jgi:hypothetical protein
MRGRLIGIGAVAAVGALVGAGEFASHECEPLGSGARSAFTSSSGSLLAVGGLIVVATTAFALISEQPPARRNYGGALVAGVVLAVVVVGLAAFVLYQTEPTCD